MATARTQKWRLQGRRKEIRSPQGPRSEQRRDAAQRMMAAGMWADMAGTSRTQQSHGPFPFLQGHEVCREKENTLTKGIISSASQVGKLRQQHVV